MTKPNAKKRPWNRGKTVGQRRAFTPHQVALIRHFLEQDEQLRDLALFNTAIDTILRASDLLALKVEDVTDHMGEVVDEFALRQQKTETAHVVALSDQSRKAIDAWIQAGFKFPGNYLFTGRGLPTPLSRTQYSRLVKKWAIYGRLDPRYYSTHSLRRTKSSVVYERTRNLAACKELLGHKSIGSTAAYLGVDQRQALDLAKKIEV